MQVSNHQRRRQLSSPAALAVYAGIAAAFTAAGAWLNAELGAEGNAPVPIAVIVPSIIGAGVVGVIIGRGTTRPPGGPIRPAPTSLPPARRASVTRPVPALTAGSTRDDSGPMSYDAGPAEG